LLAAGLWRTIAAAVATLLALVAITSLAFGSSVWPTWVTGIFAYSDQFAAESGEILHLMPTVFVALSRLGVPAPAAQFVQGVAAVLAAAVAWDQFRRGGSPLAAARQIADRSLAKPHDLVYRVPLLPTAA